MLNNRLKAVEVPAERARCDVFCLFGIVAVIYRLSFLCYSAAVTSVANQTIQPISSCSLPPHSQKTKINYRKIFFLYLCLYKHVWVEGEMFTVNLFWFSIFGIRLPIVVVAVIVVGVWRFYEWAAFPFVIVGNSNGKIKFYFPLNFTFYLQLPVSQPVRQQTMRIRSIVLAPYPFRFINFISMWNKLWMQRLFICFFKVMALQLLFPLLLLLLLLLLLVMVKHLFWLPTCLNTPRYRPLSAWQSICVGQYVNTNQICITIGLLAKRCRPWPPRWPLNYPHEPLHLLLENFCCCSLVSLSLSLSLSHFLFLFLLCIFRPHL